MGNACLPWLRQGLIRLRVQLAGAVEEADKAPGTEFQQVSLPRLVHVQCLTDSGEMTQSLFLPVEPRERNLQA